MQKEIYNRKNEIQTIIEECFGNLYFCRLENEEEIDKFLTRYDPPILNQKDINNLNRAVKSNEIETVVKNLQTKKSLVESLVNSTRHIFFKFNKDLF
jgi:dihydroorotase-like cyclic amidohydrolase